MRPFTSPARWTIAWLLVVFAGCGGSRFSASPTFEGGADGSEEDGPTGDTGADEMHVDSGADVVDEREDAAPDSDGGRKEDAGPDAPEAGMEAAVEACSPTMFFLDGDGDGYGGTTTSMACHAPDSGTWVTVGGDCDDSNPTVNPGQSAFFSVGYMPTGKSSVSFDYDCSGQESESGSAAKASCGFSGLNCVGSGYIEASPARTGTGVDPFCGSAQAVTCAVTNLVCQAGAPYVTSPIACH